MAQNMTNKHPIVNVFQVPYLAAFPSIGRNGDVPGRIVGRTRDSGIQCVLLTSLLNRHEGDSEGIPVWTAEMIGDT